MFFKIRYHLGTILPQTIGSIITRLANTVKQVKRNSLFLKEELRNLEKEYRPNQKTDNFRRVKKIDDESKKELNKTR